MLFFPDNPPVCWNGRITSKTILVPFFCFCDAIKWKHYQNMPSLGIFIITTKSRNSITYQANFCLNILKQTLEGPWRNLLLSWLQAKTIACHWLLWTGGKKKKEGEKDKNQVRLVVCSWFQDCWCDTWEKKDRQHLLREDSKMKMYWYSLILYYTITQSFSMKTEQNIQFHQNFSTPFWWI